MEEERIGLFLDYENLAIGARDDLSIDFDFGPVADALAERGRVVVRRAYADWRSFEDDRHMLTANQVELIEIPALERDYVTTFVICTGDSDFTPLVHKLRELNKRVIGVGLKASTSALLPAACDEFLFYENLSGVDVPVARKPEREPAKPSVDPDDGDTAIEGLVTRTLAGLLRSGGGPVRASGLKRALLRKDPTFNEGDYGFRAFGELLRHLSERNVVDLNDEGARGDPIVTFPEGGRGEASAFALLHDLVADLQGDSDPVVLSGLKNEMRKRQSGFSERRLGYSGFLQFVRAAEARGMIEVTWSEEADDYVLVAAA
jgi:hypothetical protein